MNAHTGAKATVTTPNETDIVITREFAAPRELVFKAMNTPEYVKQWWGLRDHENHIAEIDLRVGGQYRFGQRSPDGAEVIFAGEYLELDPPGRVVFTERWDNMPDGPSENSVITATYDERDGVTVMTAVCRYPSQEVRDAVIATGMESGMQESYKRLDEVLAGL